MSTDTPHVDSVTGTATTGHAWDGIRELNTPLPRWWLWSFYLTIVWSIGYWIVYPAWPLVSIAPTWSRLSPRPIAGKVWAAPSWVARTAGLIESTESALVASRISSTRPPERGRARTNPPLVRTTR